MTTGTKIIKLAFRQIGVDSPQMPVNPESLDDALDMLNAMVAEWQDNGMTMATVPLSVIGDDLSEPLGTKLSFVYNLAIRLAPAFDVAASNELSKNAMISYGAMMRPSLEAASLLQEKDGIDLLTISPMDDSLFVQSVQKTGRAMVIHEAPDSF